MAKARIICVALAALFLSTFATLHVCAQEQKNNR